MARLLLVDDEPDILESVQDLLSVLHPELEVLTASDASKALGVLRSVPVNAIITDYRMPGMDGAELANEVRKSWPTTRLLLLTAYTDAETQADIERRSPGLDIMSKGLNVDLLLAKIRQLLGGFASPARSRMTGASS